VRHKRLFEVQYGLLNNFLVFFADWLFSVNVTLLNGNFSSTIGKWEDWLWIALTLFCANFNCPNVSLIWNAPKSELPCVDCLFGYAIFHDRFLILHNLRHSNGLLGHIAGLGCYYWILSTILPPNPLQLMWAKFLCMDNTYHFLFWFSVWWCISIGYFMLYRNSMVLACCPIIGHGFLGLHCIMVCIITGN